MEAKCLLPFAIKCRACKLFYDIYTSKQYVFSLIPLRLGGVNLHFLMRYVKNWRALRHFSLHLQLLFANQNSVRGKLCTM